MKRRILIQYWCHISILVNWWYVRMNPLSFKNTILCHFIHNLSFQLNSLTIISNYSPSAQSIILILLQGIFTHCSVSGGDCDLSAAYNVMTIPGAVQPKGIRQCNNLRSLANADTRTVWRYRPSIAIQEQFVRRKQWRITCKTRQPI